MVPGTYPALPATTTGIAEFSAAVGAGAVWAAWTPSHNMAAAKSKVICTARNASSIGAGG